VRLLCLSLLVSVALSTARAATQAGDVRVTAARANVRQEANEKSAVLTQVTYGQTLTLRGVDGDWYRVVVALGGLRVEGYISKSVAVIAGAGDSKSATRTPTDAGAAVIPGISVAADISGHTSWLAARLGRIVPVATQANSVAEILPAEIDVGLRGATPLTDTSADVAWVWIVEGSPTMLAGPRPSFFVSFGDARGVKVDDLAPAIVRLRPIQDPYRVLAMARGRADAAGRSDLDWTVARDLKQDTMKVAMDAGAAGMVTVRLSAPLAPGDYAVVLRPLSARKYAGRDVLGAEGIGQILAAAWPFTIR
jgi:hypothetical protein